MGNHGVYAFFAGPCLRRLDSRAQDDSNMHLYGECTHETIHEDCLSHVVDQEKVTCYDSSIPPFSQRRSAQQVSDVLW